MSAVAGVSVGAVAGVSVGVVSVGVETVNRETLDVVIVGGGITGLAAAWYVHRSRPELRFAVLEATSRVGGKIDSASVAGHDVDCGPDAFLARVAGGVDLATDVGLGDDLVSPATGKAWLWSRGKLRALPEGLVLGVPSRLAPLAKSGIVSMRGLARAALDEVRPARWRAGTGGAAVGAGDPSVAAASGAHLGREVVERLVDPLLGGINASDCDTLSLASAAPNLVAPAAQPRLMRALRNAGAEQQRGAIGVEQTRPVFLVPRTGISSLVRTLHEKLPSGTVRLSSPVDTLAASGQGGWVLTVNGHSIRARSIVLAAPAAVTARLLRATNPTAAAELARIRTSSVALALLAYPTDAVDLPPGSGMLVPRVDGHLMTASSWWHQKWPHLVTPGLVLIRASAGRDGDTRFADLNDEELVARLHGELGRAVTLRGKPVDSRVARWTGGFPQYDSGHAARVDRAEASLAADAPGLILAGASYRGIGIPACIRSAQAAADRAVASLA